jgi:hypothetical protein
MAKATTNTPIDPIDREIKIRTAPAWLPETGARLTATVAAVRIGSSEYGPYPVVVLESSDGTFYSVHAFHTLLQNQLVDIAPKVGDVLTVAYAGQVTRTEEEKTKGKQEYHNYVVIPGDESALLHAEPENLDWSNFRK